MTTITEQSGQSERHQYKPLSQPTFIRLLHLKQSSAGDIHEQPQEGLSAELIEVDPSSNPEYEALSYVWGSDVFTSTLHLPSGIHKITPNLASALRALRYADKPRTLWADAVCINQADDDEKGLQVAQMDIIYSKASRVVAWLGGDSPQFPSVDKAAITDLVGLAREAGLDSFAPDHQLWDTLRSWLYGNKERSGRVMRAMESATAAGFPRLYESAWFTRMWIVQEAVLARQLTLFYGEHAVEFADFERVVLLLQTITAGIRIPAPSRAAFGNAQNLIRVCDFWRRQEGGASRASRESTTDTENANQAEDAKEAAASLFFYMNQLRQRDCKDERDRIFALRGLVPGTGSNQGSETGGLDIQVDYKKGVVRTYTEFARRLLLLGHVEVLYEAGLWKRRHTMGLRWPHSLPSWVPEYRKDMRLDIIEARFGSQLGRDPAVVPSLDLTLEPFRMAAQATVVDVVDTVYPSIFIYSPSLRRNHIGMFLRMREHCIKLMGAVCQRYKGRNWTYPIGEDAMDIMEALAHTLVGGATDGVYQSKFGPGGDHGGDGLKPLELWRIYERQCLEATGGVYVALKEECRRRMNEQEAGTEEESNIGGVGTDFYTDADREGGIAWDYHHHLVSVLTRHCLFITAEGFMGIGPAQVDPNGSDFVAFIQGAKVPFLMRNLEDGGDSMLVGPCYIHGAMDSKAVRENISFKSRKITIV